MTLSVRGASLCLDARRGQVVSLVFNEERCPIEPFRLGAGSGGPGETAGSPLAGDVFAAPASGAGAAAWEVEELVQSGRAVVVRLRRSDPVQGARVEKELRLRSGEPVLYQSHRLSGGDGALAVAHRPILCVGQGDRLCFSPKRGARTADAPPAPGAQRLAYPGIGSDISRFPGRDGPIDLQRYPGPQTHEDTVTLIEAEGRGLGWTAVLRAAEGDIVFVLKDPSVLPVTRLWYAGGSGGPAPCQRGEGGVLGIGDGCAPAAEDGDANGAGVATHLALGPGREHVVRHALGAVRRPAGWQSVTDIALDGGTLTLTAGHGAQIHLPFDGGFFGAARARASA